MDGKKELTPASAEATRQLETPPSARLPANNHMALFAPVLEKAW